MVGQQGFDLATNIWLSLWSDDPNSALPEGRNKYKEGQGRRRRKRSSKEDRGSEPTVSKVMVDDSEVIQGSFLPLS